MAHMQSTYPIDCSAILFLAQMRRNHTNLFRFTVTLQNPVCPVLLQTAADRVFSRFPTIFAGIRTGFFSHRVVPCKKAPRVAEDSGVLQTMSREEIQSCGYRILYSGNKIIIEAFHALTDGYGAIVSLRTLAAEYLYLRHGVCSPERQNMLETGAADIAMEVRDAHLDHASQKAARLPGRYSYQLPGENRDWNPKATLRQFSTARLLEVARQQGVTITTMLSCLMAEAIMEIQNRHASGGKKRPVRIMVPIDLRRLYGSRTLRNFSLYALPTLEWEDTTLPRESRMAKFHSQLKQQVTKQALSPQISANVHMQQKAFFRMIPLWVKLTGVRVGYHFLGETNSSITMTNLGAVAFSEELKSYIHGIEVLLTPRRKSPYNCGIISCGDTTSISITRFGAQPELETLFYEKLHSVLQ